MTAVATITVSLSHTGSCFIAENVISIDEMVLLLLLCIGLLARSNNESNNALLSITKLASTLVNYYQLRQESQTCLFTASQSVLE